MVSMTNKRRDKDVMKMLVSSYKVELVDENKMNEIVVDLAGPQGSAYAHGVWQVRVQLPDQYPIKSPSIGFLNKIFHPNIDEASGSVCLDVINQTWSPMFDLINIFDSFLPQLLMYPNPTDPLNNEAASLLLKSEEQFADKVKEYIKKYASQQKPAGASEEEAKGGEQQTTNHSSGNEDGVRRNKEQIGNGNDSEDEVKEHQSELSATSDIEMMDIDDGDE